LYWLGRAALEQRDFPVARSHFEQASRLLEGTNAEILRYLGLTEIRAGSYDKGSKLLLESMKLDRGAPETLGGLEEGLRALGDPVGAGKALKMRERAEEIRNRLLQLRNAFSPFEDKGPAFIEIAHLYRQQGSSSEAVRYYRLARAASPSLVAPYRALAELAATPNEIFFRAHNLAGLVRLDAGDARALRDLAFVYAQLGVALDQGLHLAQRSLQIEDCPDGRYVLAEILFQQGDLEATMREAKAAMQASPGDERFQELAQRVGAKVEEASLTRAPLNEE
jgi:tetratricopeptide (TPR) repeat protein